MRTLLLRNSAVDKAIHSARLYSSTGALLLKQPPISEQSPAANPNKPPQQQHFTTSVPAVADFWNHCVSTPQVCGPNVALAKVRKISDHLNAADSSQQQQQQLTPSDSGEAAAVFAGIAMTKNDAVLHATVSSRMPTPLIGDSTNNSSSPTSSSPLDHYLPAPEFIYRRKTKEIQAEAEKIYHAYQEYYNHIKFRNGWEKPVFPKDDPLVVDMLREASDICSRIRSRLDEENPNTKLRQADGSAQLFFNSPEAAKLFHAAKSEADAGNNASGAPQMQRRDFVKTVVLNTFKDAMGYVEGLTKTKIEKYFFDISDFGFNPSAHVQHLLLEMLASAEVARMTFDVADAAKYSHDSFGIVSQEEPLVQPDANNTSVAASNTSAAPVVSRKAHDKARLSRDNSHFCDEDSVEDKAWRDTISKLYKAHDALLIAMNERKKSALRQTEVSKVVPTSQIK